MGRSEGSPTQEETLPAIPRSGGPRHCTRRQRAVTSKAGRAVARVEGQGGPSGDQKHLSLRPVIQEQ